MRGDGTPGVSPRDGGPPRLALWLLTHLLPPGDREAFVGDLCEAFDRRARDRRGRGAGRWFWRETLVAVATLVVVAPRRRREAAIPVPSHFTLAGDPLVLTFLSDLRHGARLLRRSPAFAALAILTLGMGIGATTAIFSLVNPVLLRSLPYPAAERLVALWERDAEGATSNTGFATFKDVARQTRTIERVAVMGDWQPTLNGDDPSTGSGQVFAERLAGERVTAGYFATLGVRPAVGRDFVASEDVQDQRHVVVLTHGLWVRRFGADPAAVGRAIPLDGVPHVVVGVLPASFDNVLAPDAQIYRVLGYDESLPWACRTCRHLRMVGRLRAGVTREAAAAELDRLSRLLVQAHPRDYAAPGMLVVPLQEEVTRSFRPVLLAVVGASALLLLIAAANVANLQLARTMRRDGEFAVRAALGAGRGRLARQLLAEGMLLAALGGAAGLLVARLSLPALLARLPATLPRLGAVRLDFAALAVASAVTLLLGVVIGLVPAWRGGQASVFDTLRGGSRLGASGRHVARAGLVVSEVALALMLLVGAGLLSRSLVRLMSVDVGFDPARLLTLQVQATGTRYESDAAVFANHDRIREAVLAVPGVTAAGIASQLPLGGNVDSYGVAAEDKPLANPELAPSADRYAVSPDFMRAMGIAVLRGRGFAEADARDTADKVAIVSAALAAKIWPGEDPLGKRIRIGGPTRPWRRVVGVARNVRHSGLDAKVTHQIYVPERQYWEAENQVTLVVRTAGDPARSAAAIRRAVQAVDPSQPVTRLATMDQVVAASTAQRRLALLLFAAFAGAAVVLAAAGIYGVLAGSVTERTREIGLRSALGATPRDVLSLVLLQGVRLAAVGLAVGVTGALGVGRVLQGLLYDVRPADPLTLGATAAVLAVVAVLACVIPARRALRVDPMAALRTD